MKYIFATDGSLVSNRALEDVSKMIKKETDELVILSVAHPDISVFFEADKNVETVKRVTDEHNAIVDRVTRLAKDTFGIKNVRGEVILGDPREQIVSFADKENADVIAMGARGLGTLQRLLIGSVSTYVLKHANCNVLIAKV